ncbi:MAG: hypothetical protein K2Q01_05100, partial [Rickettsiales bacterium]|nr:hypothetical protein [Rickettsiales bacterium]
HAMRMSKYIGERGKYLELWLQYKLLLNLGFPAFADLGKQAVENIRQTVLETSKLTPLRDDLASYYLMNLKELSKGDKVMEIDILRELLEAVPNHRPAMWLLGNILIKTPATKAEGEEMIRKAVAARVQDVYSVTNEELKPWKQ